MKNFRKIFFMSVCLVGFGLSGCGGSGDSNSPKNNDSTAKDDIVEPPTEAEDNVSDDEIRKLLTSRYLNERALCGFGEANSNNNIANAAKHHADYLTYIFTKSGVTPPNTHKENTLIGYEDVSGGNNPYFSGSEITQRLKAANYVHASYGGAEALTIKNVFYPNKIINNKEEVANGMYATLLSAPYHMRSMLLTSIDDVGMGFNSYVKKGNNQEKSRSYLLVMNAGYGKDAFNDKFDGNKAGKANVLTYPCDKMEDVAHILTHESPNPFKNSRNLRTDPIGHTLYVRGKTGNDIQVSNVIYKESDTNISIPVQLIDKNNDPYENTNFEVGGYEAFIMPLTENYNKCKKGIANNCGLKANTKYTVSFDVQEDSVLKRHTVTFKTGNEL